VPSRIEKEGGGKPLSGGEEEEDLRKEKGGFPTYFEEMGGTPIRGGGNFKDVSARIRRMEHLRGSAFLHPGEFPKKKKNHNKPKKEKRGCI